MASASELNALIGESSKIVFFGGAGVSVPSGIPDFRSPDGLYNQKYKYPPEIIISASFFERDPEEFYRFYKDKMLFPNAKPNMAHLKLAELEKAGKLLSVVTQNIDGLHQAAGSERVWELHGSVHRNYCLKCGKFFDLAYMLAADGVPRCDKCGGIVKPDVVLYEESLDSAVIDGAIADISRCDLLIIGGTSMSVYPAAGLVRYRPHGSRLAVVNKTPTPSDSAADLVIGGSIDEVFAAVQV